MNACPRCGAPLSADSSLCPRCGTDAMSVSSTPTRLFDEPGGGGERSPVRPPSSGPSSSASSAGHVSASSSDPHDGAHFFPGQRLGDRYRIGALIGKGGMGEVYRADDLKLGQPVALKLLPPALAEDPERLERFYAEVRLARSVSHPNVCRVYDVSEIEGRQVLTMELIDGEDLATLLRRIGRLAPDKAVEIARQICAGLAAAHDRGILHRDLKPANIMLDGRGRARITDFGLAAITGSVKGLEIQSGTPIYMSPEQLEGREVTVRSDVYSLGVVLYEIFTGKRVYDATSMAALVDQQSWSRPMSVSSHVSDIDPVIERVILRCLERDPASRPPSPLAVAAGLPGGDPLAAALAAGETPSPEMVAAAGGEGALRLRTAVVLLALFLGGLVCLALSMPWATLNGRAGLGKPPSVLMEKARDVLARAGYKTPPADHAFGFTQSSDYLTWLREHSAGAAGWSDLKSAQRPVIGFWYREGPRPFEPENMDGIVRPNDPVPLTPGMAQVFLDSWGRLSSFVVVPPQIETKDASGASLADAPSSAAGDTPTSANGSAPPDWTPFFGEAGLDKTAFRSVSSIWVPLYYADNRMAWEGALPWQDGVTGRVEAASYRGSPVYFAVMGPWTQPRRSMPYSPTMSETVGQALNIVFFMMLLCGAIVLGRWNIRAGRGDRKGAFRLALFLFVGALLTWLARADHVASFGAEWDQFVRACAGALFDAGLVWLLYMALEPFVRWRWPDSIVGWTRLIGGGYRDPLVGRDILIGVVFGVAMSGIFRLRPFLESILVGTESVPPLRGFASLSGPGLFIAGLLEGQKDSIQSAMILLFFSFMGIGPMKRKWPAWLIFGSISMLMGFLFWPSTSLAARLMMSFVYAVLLTTLLMRFGVLAAIAAQLVISWSAPLSLDFSGWNSPQLVVLWLLLLGLGGYAFWIALGRRHHASLMRTARPGPSR